MADFNAKYNSKEIYSNSKQSKSNNDVKMAVQKMPEPLTAFTSHTTEIYSNFDSLYTPYIGIKLI